MAEVKWIKLKVGMFDGMSFKKIKKAKIGGESFRDKLTAVWFELMDFAGRCNHDGAFISPREIPFYELADIATMIDRDEEELSLCMSFFINEGMVSVVDDVYMLSNWSEYQNTDGLEKIREQNRLRQAKFKEKQKLLSGNVTGNVTVTQGNATDIDKDKELDKEKDKDTLSKDKVKRAKKAKAFSEDEGLNNTILEYIEFRKKLKKPMTDNAIDRLIKRLQGMTDDVQEQIDILNQSIDKGWMDIYPLKAAKPQMVTGGRNAPTAADDPNIKDKMERLQKIIDAI